MRIAYVGNFKFPFCTERHIEGTLHSLGHQVIRLQEDEIDKESVIREGNAADLFLWTRTPGMLKFDGWDIIKEIKKPKASYHLDLYMGISREKDVKDDPFFHTDYVFQADGDEESLRKFRELGINAIWMPAAVYEFECYLAAGRDDFRTDVAFIGSYHYHSEWSYRQQLIDRLRADFGERFKLYPNELKNVVMCHELNQMMASVKVVVGDSLCVGFKHTNYWSNRIMETLGRGGFLIAPRIKGLDEVLKDKEHLVYYDFGNFEQLKELVEYYLVHDEERYRIMIQGHREVKKNHTFTNRLIKCLEIMGFENGK